MRELCILTDLELRSLLGWNKFRHGKDPREKRRYLLLAGTGVFLGLLGIAYIVGLSFGLSYLGMGNIIPAYLAFLASVIVFVVGVFRTGNTLFRSHGYGLLTAMPISARAVVLSRWCKLYIEDIALTLLILIPGILTYGIIEGAAWYVYPLSVLLSLFLPLLPLCLSMLVGTLAVWISSHVKHKALAESALMVALVLSVFFGTYSLGMNGEEIAMDRLAELACVVGDLIKSIYPPAVWYADAVCSVDLPSLLPSVLVPSTLTVGMLTLSVKAYHGILRRLRHHFARSEVHLHGMVQKGLLQTLCRREAKRYFASSVYVTNTIIGPILAVVAAVAMMILGVDELENAIPAELGLNIRAVLPMALASIFCMMPATATAYSMEGRQFWIVKTLPIPSATLWDAKVLFWLLMLSPFYLISVILMTVALAPSLMEWLWLISLPAAAILFSAVFGITVDLRLGKTEWEHEITVVKQSASSGVGGLAGFLISMFTCLPVLFLEGVWSHLTRGVILIALLIAAYLMRRANHRKLLSAL